MSSKPHAPVVTILLLLGLLGVVAAILLPAITPHGYVNSRQAKDAAQLNQIHKAMVIWANDHPSSPDEEQPADGQTTPVEAPK